jgi:hypothetical protein
MTADKPQFSAIFHDPYTVHAPNSPKVNIAVGDNRGVQSSWVGIAGFSSPPADFNTARNCAGPIRSTAAPRGETDWQAAVDVAARHYDEAMRTHAMGVAPNAITVKDAADKFLAAETAMVGRKKRECSLWGGELSTLCQSRQPHRRERFRHALTQFRQKARKVIRLQRKQPLSLATVLASVAALRSPTGSSRRLRGRRQARRSPSDLPHQDFDASAGRALLPDHSPQAAPECRSASPDMAGMRAPPVAKRCRRAEQKHRAASLDHLVGAGDE